MKSLKVSFSKKAIATALALTVMTGAALQPKRAEAIIALAAVTVPQSVLTGVFTISLASVTTGVMSYEFFRNDSFQDTMFTISQLSFIVGLVLDDSGQQKVVLKPINNDLARSAGVSAEEQDSYNHELDIIQASFDDISAQVAPLKDSERTPQAHKLWNDYRSAISPAAYSAFEKVTAHLAQQK